MKETKGGQVLLRVVEYGPREGGVALRAAWASEALVPGGTLPVIQDFSPHEGHNGAGLWRVATSSKVSSQSSPLHPRTAQAPIQSGRRQT